MDFYSYLREFADSWVLLAMFVFFVGVGIWAFLPSQESNRQDASMIPFRNDAPDLARSATSEAGQSKDVSRKKKGQSDV